MAIGISFPIYTSRDLNDFEFDADREANGEVDWNTYGPSNMGGQKGKIHVSLVITFLNNL